MDVFTAVPQKNSDGRAGLLESFYVEQGDSNFLTAGVVLGVDRLQARLRDVRVDLGG